MKYSQWVSTYKGKRTDFDGAYGVQCVDLAKLFIKKVICIEPQSIGNAIEYYNKRATELYLTTNFKWMDYKKGFDFKAGDLIVFHTPKAVKTGHIAVCTGNETGDYVETYDQNYNGKGSGMTLNKHRYDDYTHKVLGVLRPKNRKNIDVEEIIVVKKSVVYFKQYNGNSHSLVDALDSIKANYTFAYRKKIAKANGINNYIGTSGQNTSLLYKLKKGKLIKP